MLAMRERAATACLLAGLVLSACGGDDEKKNTACLPGDDPALAAASRAHVDKIIVGAEPVDARKVEVDKCRTGDEDATATVTVLGVKDTLVADQRHQMRLEKKNAKWAIVRDLDTQRCRKGHGHRDFSALQCK